MNTNASQDWDQRARRVIPGGHHLSGRPLVGDTALYLDAAYGARVRTVDGQECIDWLMAYGPFLLGYGRKEVDEAARKQAAKAQLVSLNHPLHVEFIERLLPLFPGAEMGTYFRTGSEATTAALRIARRATGRRRIARCGYHGWHDWCLPLESFVPAGLDLQVLEYSANDPATLSRLFEAYPHEVAAVILAPEMMRPLSKERLQSIAELARTHEAVFIMDEVKTGLRAPAGSIAASFGIVPDIITLSKAIGNGWAVAATLGRRDVMQHAAGMHLSATFHGDLAAMAAALETITIARAEGASDHVAAIGTALLEGLAALANAHGVAVDAFAEPIPAMPFMRFENADDERVAQLRDRFYIELLSRGVLLHPRHLWFPSLAHTQLDVEATLEAADASLRKALQMADTRGGARIQPPLTP